jgi:uncharacterized protein YceK
MKSMIFVLVLLVLASGCATNGTSSGATAGTPADAKKFIDDVNDTTFKLALEASQAG